MENTLIAGARQLNLSSPVCMGVLNVTPDSFSDGAVLKKASCDKFTVDLDKALVRAEQMVNEGAVIIDVGGESTRPGATTVSVSEELERVVPIIEAIHARLDVIVSVDTSTAEVMQAAVLAGAGLINDVRALAKPRSLATAQKSNAALCLMHMQGNPDTMQQTFGYDDVMQEVITFLQQRIDDCLQAGISRSRLIVDPGFGFGKSIAHNYLLLKNLEQFKQLQCPIMVGISRKSMIGNVINRPVDQRLAGSIAAASRAMANGADIIRSHDVAATVDAIKIHEQLK